MVSCDDIGGYEYEGRCIIEFTKQGSQIKIIAEVPLDDTQLLSGKASFYSSLSDRLLELRDEIIEKKFMAVKEEAENGDESA